jgi:hypothetical protein
MCNLGIHVVFHFKKTGPVIEATKLACAN